jgi:Domain of Unknown Function (DUF1080)
MRRILLTLALCCAAATSGNAADDTWQDLFNGKDLTGWKGKPELWSVKDGAITGYTKDGKIPGGNSFLIWDGKVADFELKAQFKIVGGNSGIQYRSKAVGKAEDFVVGGYQADIDSAGARKAEFLGILYEERGRGFLCNRGTKTWIDESGVRFEKRVTESKAVLAATKDNDWNEYEVIAKANHLVQKINGKVTADVVDFQKSKRAAEGLLAFQIHAGMGEMTVQFKDIKLKVLTGVEEVTPEKDPIPADATNLAPKPKAKEAKK